MIRRLIILLLIVGCEEAGLNTDSLTNGTAVTDTLYISHDTTIFIFDTVFVNHDTTITFEYDTTISINNDTTITINYDTTITFEYDTTITVYDTTIAINDTIIIYEDSDCMGIVGGGAFIDDCDQCVGGTTEKLENYLQDNCGLCGGDCNTSCDICGVCNGDGSSCTTVTDIDGNIYHTIQISEQIWMVENLKVTHYNNGDEITYIINEEDWGSYEEGQYGIYNNDSTNFEIYGNLYNWAAAANGTEFGDLVGIPDYGGICPEGFHVPDNSDWDELLDFFGGWSGAGGLLKECTVGSCPESEYWNSPNSGATNYSGFTALPAGIIFTETNESNVFMLGYFTAFWSSIFENSLYMTFNGSDAHLSYALPVDGTEGISVRCLKD